MPSNNKEILIKYKDQITDPFKLADHYNTIRLFKSDAYIKEKFVEAINNNFDCKTISNIYNKIKLIKTIETKYSIVNFACGKSYSENILSSDEYNLIKTIFRISRDKPENDDELILMYVTMIKNICGNEIIEAKRIRNKSEKKRVYEFNEEYLNFHNELALYYSKNNDVFDIFNDEDIDEEYENINGIILKKINIDLNEIYMFINDAKYFLNSIHINKNIIDV